MSSKFSGLNSELPISNDILEKYGAYQYNSIYQLRLVSDNEMLAKADIVYDTQYLISKNHTLDSAFFGASSSDPWCKICGQGMRECPGHYSVIQLPFPICKAVCLDFFKKLITIICPVCAHLLIPDAKNALLLDSEFRLQWLKDKTTKLTHDGELFVDCPVCKNKVTTFVVKQPEPQLHVCLRRQNNIYDLINPVLLHTLLQNFTEIEEAGFSDTFHPKNFMTTLIPIVPNKLRPKTAQESESILMSYYKMIIEDMVPSLNSIYKTLSSSGKPFIEQWDPSSSTMFVTKYDRLMAYYMLITDTSAERTKEACLNLIDKKDRTYFDKRNALLGRFKKKESTIFSKGIIGTRHNVSCRTVLGGATDAPIKSVNIPYHIASKLSMLYPVYEENLRGMRQLVAAMSMTENINNPYIPKVIAIQRGQNNGYIAINIKNATSMASTLMPGDKLSITLLNGDYVQQMRFPSIREESWTSLQVNKDNNTIITIPLCITGMKTADFDGDESQVYIPSSHVVDVEAMLLHSTFRFLIAYKDGDPAIWYSADAPYGISQMKPSRKSSIFNNHAVDKPIDVIQTIESFLPKDFTYIDSKTEIVNGKFRNNKTNVDNKEMHKYMNSLYGPVVTEDFMDRIVQLAYDLNRDNGNTLGFEIRIYGKENKRKIRAIIDKTYNEMKRIEQSNDKYKSIKQINATEKQKTAIKTLLLDAAKGTNLDKLGLLNKYQDEYYQMCVLLNHITIDGDRIQPSLAEGSRVNVSYPRYSVDPAAYGYSNVSYDSDISPVTHLYDTKAERVTLFQKGKGTAKQGYMQKRMGVTFGTAYVDFNGALVNNFRLISPQYGACGLNPRLYTQLPLIDLHLSDKEFTSKYHDKELIRLRSFILDCQERYKLITSFARSEVIKDVFVAGFNYEQFFNNACKSGSTDQKLIEKFIQKIKDVFVPAGCDAKYVMENLAHHEYYFRVKCATLNIPESMLDECVDHFTFALADGGDAVGMKAALACSEPLTQASLHSIHHVGGGAVINEENLERSAGITRFEELITGTGKSSTTSTVITFKLYDDSKEACIKFANEYEMFYYNAIWTRMELSVCSGKVCEKICNLHPSIDQLHDIDVNPYFVTSIWNLTSVSSYNIHVVDIINKLMKNFSEIMFITGYILNSSEFMAYIYFQPDIPYSTITNIMEEWGLEKPSTIVHGKYLSKCYVSENKNMPGHYIIEANEVSAGGNSTMALENLIFDERVDPLGCKTTNMNVIQKMYGIMEADARCAEELIYTAINLSYTSGILVRHYKLISDMIYSEGFPRHAERNKMMHDHYMDAFRKINFETAKNMIVDSLRTAEVHPVADSVSCAVMGELPTLGTGCSKVMLVRK